MTLENLHSVLGWCTLINTSLLGLWLLAFTQAHDSLYKLHSRWFKISPEHFDTVHYASIAFYKLIILVFNVIPYVALFLIKR